MRRPEPGRRRPGWPRRKRRGQHLSAVPVLDLVGALDRPDAGRTHHVYWKAGRSSGQVAATDALS